MTSARILQILLAGLFVGVIPLRAGGDPTPGGDGGVVILPFTAIQLSSGATASTLSAGSSGSNSVSVSLSLAGSSGELWFKLPPEMLNAYAVIMIPEHSIAFPAHVIAGHMLLDVQMLTALELEINHLEVLVVSDNRLGLWFSIELEGAEKAETAETAETAGTAGTVEKTETAERTTTTETTKKRR